ncbi:MAG: DUF3105 domain-containing protein [Rhodospirillales bacterium]|nr:DUF3105 domain-containing protein [Rhodospirillales bacterium]
MAKSGKKAAAKDAAKSAAKTSFGPERIAIGLVIAAALVGAWWWSQDRGAETEFLALAQSGKDKLTQVRSSPSRGQDHLRPGQFANYTEEFPNSGPHAPSWVSPGFYETRQVAEEVVHTLEHGIIVVYYDQPGAETLATLRAWADLYDAEWQGVAAIPRRGLGSAVVVAAWTKLLRLEAFDPAAAAAFIDAYRGRGPENPVR